MQRKRPDEVDLDGQLELLHRVGLGRLGFLVATDRLGGIGDTGAIDQDPLLPMRVARLGEGGGDLLVAGHVDLAEHAADLAGNPFSAFGVAVEYRDLGAPTAQARAPSLRPGPTRRR